MRKILSDIEEIVSWSDIQLTIIIFRLRKVLILIAC